MKSKHLCTCRDTLVRAIIKLDLASEDCLPVFCRQNSNSQTQRFLKGYILIPFEALRIMLDLIQYYLHLQGPVVTIVKRSLGTRLARRSTKGMIVIFQFPSGTV